jgi:hypothetical protein
MGKKRVAGEFIDSSRDGASQITRLTSRYRFRTDARELINTAPSAGALKLRPRPRVGIKRAESHLDRRSRYAHGSHPSRRSAARPAANMRIGVCCGARSVSDGPLAVRRAVIIHNDKPRGPTGAARAASDARRIWLRCVGVSGARCIELRNLP